MLEFQSLTRDSNHSNAREVLSVQIAPASFNPSRGIAIIQTSQTLRTLPNTMSFNPSRGIAIIQTRMADAVIQLAIVSIPHAG